MALEILGESVRSSRARVQRSFAATHNLYLTLNNEIASAGPCFRAYLPAWRRDRNAWAAFYSRGWSSWRMDERDQFQKRVYYWRSKLIRVCGLAERDVPLYARL